ncbi:MAG: hypothetical protein ABIQ04_04305 [Candidatus Saccharimonadales bacterium]
MQIKKSKSNKKAYIIIVIILLLLGASLFTYFYIKQQSANSRKTQYGSESTNPTTNVPTPSTVPTTGPSIGSSKDGSSSPSNNVVIDPSKTPSTPVGTFVSNHKPNLNGSPAPNTMNSVCSTTPGASCVIEFTKDNQTLLLIAKTADASGNVTWDWKLQDIGLTAGTWTVTAIAKNGSLSAQSTDPTKLEVMQ